jgi:FixJ family two-component response regulator
MGMTESPDEETVRPEREITVLLVDDDELWVQSTAQLLEQQRDRFQVKTATDLSAGKATFEDIEPDCVVCDYNLDERSGLDLLTAVRKKDTKKPFILITGQGSEQVASDAIKKQATDYIPKRSLGRQGDRLARRIETVVKSYRTQQRLAKERRSKDAMLEILQATSSQEEITQQFCDHLVAERDYSCAWIGSLGESGDIVPRAVAGQQQYLDVVIDLWTANERFEPALRALDRGEPVGVGPISDQTDDWQEAAVECGFNSAVAVPVVYEATVFGVLAVYSERRMIPDDEQQLLSEYGETIGYALQSAEWKESLLAPKSVRIDIKLTDGKAALVAVSQELEDDTHAELLTTVLQEETLLYILEVSGPTATALEQRASRPDAVSECNIIRDTNPLRCELTVPFPTPETILAKEGFRVTKITVESGCVTLTAVGRSDSNAQPMIDALQSTYGGTSVHRIREQSALEADPPKTECFERLTEKQRQALKTAYYQGYFRRPRDHNATEVAAKLDISRHTFDQHLRSGQRKLLEELFEKHNTAGIDITLDETKTGSTDSDGGAR